MARALLISVVLGAVGATVALAFVAVVAAGQSVLWPAPIDPTAFSGSIRIPIIMTAGGLLVGVIHVLVRSAQEENVFVALATGQINATAVPGGVAIAAVSLIAGFSLGSEVPTGMAAAGLAAFAVSRHLVRRRDAEVAMSAAISGAWGGLFTAPFTALLLNVELTVERSILRWARLAADATAAIVGFAIFFAVDAGWSNVLRLLDLPPFELGMWELLLAVGFGVVGAVVGTLFKISMLGTRRLASRFRSHPVLRCTATGLVLGLAGMALPLTLFLGTDGLAQVTGGAGGPRSRADPRQCARQDPCHHRCALVRLRRRSHLPAPVHRREPRFGRQPVDHRYPSCPRRYGDDRGRPLCGDPGPAQHRHADHPDRGDPSNGEHGGVRRRRRRPHRQPTHRGRAPQAGCTSGVGGLERPQETPATARSSSTAGRSR